MAAEPKYGRRDFFKDSVISVAKAAKEYAAHADAPPEKPAPLVRTDWLRPPGAVSEALFLERCTKCGDCAKACPHESIVPHQDGTPVIFPDQVPCYLCDDVPCIAACATEALLAVPDMQAIRMGVAVVNHRLCTAGQGCHACVSKCPTDALAMDFDAQHLVVTGERCVGCGMCEHICRTVNDHIAIKISPSRSMEASPR
jgi:ferredoxin-type protein NapG